MAINVVHHRACMLDDLQWEYSLLLDNADCVFIQLEYLKDGMVDWLHLKGCEIQPGQEPEDINEFLNAKLGKLTQTNKWYVRCLHYHYGDKRFRELTIEYPRKREVVR